MFCTFSSPYVTKSFSSIVVVMAHKNYKQFMNNPTDRPKIPHKASKSYLIFDSPTIYILVTKHDGIPLLSCEWDQHTVSFARAGETVRLELNPEINIPNERSPGYINDFFYTGN